MIVRKVFPDIPTSSVAWDLLSRVGYATRYSLSPFKGLSREKFQHDDKLRKMRESDLYEPLIRSKDVFDFHHVLVFYSVAERNRDLAELEEEDEDEDDIVGDDEVVKVEHTPVYHIWDTEAPLYVRRFEDYLSTERIKSFIDIVIYNSYADKDGYETRREQLGRSVNYESDDALINENELVIDEVVDADERRLIAGSKSALIRSMYRLILLSRILHVSMISILLAYCRFYKYSTSKIECKPQLLMEKGPVYRVNSVGDCVDVVSDANSREVRKAREVYWTRNTSDAELVAEFRNDCDTFIRCIANLSINADACDARKYTYEWASYYSREILVNNYTYVLRKSGGYSVDVLNQLREMSLDAVTNEVTESHIEYSNMISLLDDLEGEASTSAFGEIPASLVADLRQSNSRKLYETSILLAELLSGFETDAVETGEPPVMSVAGEMFVMDTSPEGFILSEDKESLFTVYARDLLEKAAWVNFTFKAYVHCTGWLVFEPVANYTYVISLDTLSRFRNSGNDRYEMCPRYACGPEKPG